LYTHNLTETAVSALLGARDLVQCSQGNSIRVTLRDTKEGLAEVMKNALQVYSRTQVFFFRAGISIRFEYTRQATGAS
jgi:hypothetical protein